MYFELGLILLGLIIFLLSLSFLFMGMIKQSSDASANGRPPSSSLPSADSVATTLNQSKFWLARSWKSMLVTALVLCALAVGIFAVSEAINSPQGDLQKDYGDVDPALQEEYAQLMNYNLPTHFSNFETQGNKWTSLPGEEEKTSEQKWEYAVWMHPDLNASRQFVVLRGGALEEFRGVPGRWIIIRTYNPETKTARQPFVHRMRVTYGSPQMPEMDTNNGERFLVPIGGEVYVFNPPTGAKSRGKVNDTLEFLPGTSFDLKYVYNQDQIFLYLDGKLTNTSKQVSGTGEVNMIVTLFVPENKTLALTNIERGRAV